MLPIVIRSSVIRQPEAQLAPPSFAGYQLLKLYTRGTLNCSSLLLLRTRPLTV